MSARLFSFTRNVGLNFHSKNINPLLTHQKQLNYINRSVYTISLQKERREIVFTPTLIRVARREQCSDNSKTGGTESESSSHEDITEQIRSIIEEKIKPLVQEDGGDLEFVEYVDKVVRVRLQGACTTCPSSTVTLQSGVKNMLQYYIPEVEEVEQVFD